MYPSKLNTLPLLFIYSTSDPGEETFMFYNGEIQSDENTKELLCVY